MEVEKAAGAAAASVEVTEAGEGAAVDAAKAEGAAAVFELAAPPVVGTRGVVETGARADARAPTGRDHVDALDVGTRAAIELTVLGADVVAVPAAWPVRCWPTADAWID